MFKFYKSKIIKIFIGGRGLRHSEKIHRVPHFSVYRRSIGANFFTLYRTHSKKGGAFGLIFEQNSPTFRGVGANIEFELTWKVI
jgi:hypothetical protein